MTCGMPPARCRSTARYPAAGLEVADHRNLPVDALEIVDRPFDARGMRDGQEMQHGVTDPPVAT